MVRTEWNRILSANALSLTKEEIEDLCPMVIDCDLDEISDTNNLHKLMRVSQEMLRHKDNQVESLLFECNELKESISLLKSESSTHLEKGMSNDIWEGRAIGKHPNQPKSFNYHDASLSRLDKLETLMHELQTLDMENKTLKERLTEMKEEMEDATERMNEMSVELSAARRRNTECNEKLLKLEQENVALNARNEELTRQQIERDKAIDQFGIAIDARINNWKAVLDERDLEIDHLKEYLSQSMMHSVTSVGEQTRSDITELSREIAQKDKVIVELQTRLSEAVMEMNDSASVMERLKHDAKMAEKIRDGKSDDRELLKKINRANREISELRKELDQSHDEITLKSRQLCEVLSTLRKYESKDEALTESLKEVKELKIELGHKNVHIEDLVTVVNNLEALNSYQELELTTLREKLGISEDECVSVSKAAAKRNLELSKIEKLVRDNKNLLEKNLEMKSDIRVLRYKLCKCDISANQPDCTTDNVTLTDWTKIEYDKQDRNVNSDKEAMYEPKGDVDSLKKNMQVVVEENEALREGMHEILDSIRSQDGKSTVEVHSSTLEKLLEALDVRHLAGWYHPAMRLQERLNVVQGSNAELRLQLKHLRKELERKEGVLQDFAITGEKNAERVSLDDSEHERESSYSSELDRVQHACETMKGPEWTTREEELMTQLAAAKDSVDSLKIKLECYERDWRIIESSGEESIAREYAAKSREYAEASAKILLTCRKVSALEELLRKETENAYRRQKEAIARESRMKQALADSDKHIKTLESEVETLESNLSNSVSLLEYDELKERYEEASIRLRATLDMIDMAIRNSDDKGDELTTSEIGAVEREDEPIKLFCDRAQIEVRSGDIDDRHTHSMKDTVAKAYSDSRTVHHIVNLYSISQQQLKKYETTVKDLMVANSELQARIVVLQKDLSNGVVSCLDYRAPDNDNKARDLREENELLKTENNHLERCLEISREEARSQYTLNSLKSLELDSLRHQIIDLQAITEDKAMISRLDFELTRRKLSEMELNSAKIKLEKEVQRLEDELRKGKERWEKMRLSVRDCRKDCEDRCRAYADVISYLQCQYAACTSASSLLRIAAIVEQLRIDRETVRLELSKARECRANAKLQQEMLGSRLEIVDRLKDMLERRIGNDTVEELMRDFSQSSQKFVSEFRYKRQIAHLEYELQISSDKCVEYNRMMAAMENEMLNVQRVWGERWSDDGSGNQLSDAKVQSIDTKTIGVQTIGELRSEGVQTDPYTCCLSGRNVEGPTSPRDMAKEARGEDGKASPSRENRRSGTAGDNDGDIGDDEISSRNVAANNIRKGEAQHRVEEMRDVQMLNDQLSGQLNEALRLASERSNALMRYESQMAEYRATINTLRVNLEEKNCLLVEKESAGIERIMPGVDDSDRLALRSTVQSLQRMIAQKEETVLRYQTLLKEDREEYSRTSALSQREIETLRAHARTLEEQLIKYQHGVKSGISDGEVTNDKVVVSGEKAAAQQDEIVRLREQVSTLEAELNVTKELSDRWHRLAEERLRHVDKMRVSLEEQHKNELESYRSEIDKWQSEASILRQRLSDNRVALTKGNVSLMKELQEREERIHELSCACQQLQNEVDLMESAGRSHRNVAQNEQGARKNEPSVSAVEYNHFPSQQHREQEVQLQTDSLLRRQIQSQVEKEKLFKREIAELKQRLSRRYMATKMQEKRRSQREALLERKVKSLEEELEKTQVQLDREYMTQEAKKVKTAQDLSLWEKQKMWQQTAEKLRARLRGKSDECEKLRDNYEKLRSVVMCMDREKRFLRSRLKGEYTKNMGNGENCCYCTAGRPMSVAHNSLVDDLREECQILRERVNELTDRLEKEKRRILALEALTQQPDSHVPIVSQLEKLELARDNLEKKNLNLESENFRLQLEITKANSNTPALREKVAHLEKYVEILKEEKCSDSAIRPFERESQDSGSKKSISEMERAIFSLKRIVEKLQVENKRLRLNAKKTCVTNVQERMTRSGETSEITAIRNQYEDARKRIVTLETDLQFAQQKIVMLEQAQNDDESSELNVLKQQLAHKSELLDRVKYLLTRAAINERNLRQRVQKLEANGELSIIPECHVTRSTSE